VSSPSAPFWKDGVGPSAEPLKIVIAKGDLHDASRDRRIPYKLYYPAPETEQRDLPLILWSHGLGGSRDGAGFLARFLAAQGYVICNIQHKGTDSSLWEGKPGHPWDVIRDTHIPRAAALERFRDVPFVLDHLDVIGAGHPDAGAAMDKTRLGMSGHSFGAMTAQVMAGQLFPDADGELKSFREKRFKAGILYSPVPANSQSGEQPPTIYNGIDLPLFHMTGTADDSPIEHFTYKDRLVVYENSGRAERQLLILNGGDHMVYNGSRGQLAENPKRGLHEDIIKIAALAWWDSHLKDDAAARHWLTGGAFAKWIDGEASYRIDR
jgi:predicted dienelactone hydrolase